jgi:hypothetical protein
VHAAAIAATCKTLAELVSGKTKEAQAGKVSWKHVAVDDFVRFCEWAYRGDYTVSLRENPKDIKDTKENQDANGTKNTNNTNITKNTNGTKDTKATKGSRQGDCIFSTCPGADFKPLLFAHSRLYVFANDHLIEPLKKLVATKFKKILHNPDPCICRIWGVLALAQYVYSDDVNLPGRAGWDKLDYIRSVVMESIVRISRMGYYVPFLEFLEEGGQRATDFCLLAMAPGAHKSM